MLLVAMSMTAVIVSTTTARDRDGFSAPRADAPTSLTAAPSLGIELAPSFHPYRIRYDSEAGGEHILGLPSSGVSACPGFLFTHEGSERSSRWSMIVEAPISLVAGDASGELRDADGPTMPRRHLDGHVGGVGVGLRAAVLFSPWSRLVLRAGLGIQRLEVNYRIAQRAFGGLDESWNGSFALSSAEFRTGLGLTLGDHAMIMITAALSSWEPDSDVSTAHIVNADDERYPTTVGLMTDRAGRIEVGLVIFQ